MPFENFTVASRGDKHVYILPIFQSVSDCVFCTGEHVLVFPVDRWVVIRCEPLFAGGGVLVKALHLFGFNLGCKGF